jgi:hypothetical protein
MYIHGNKSQSGAWVSQLIGPANATGFDFI